MFTPNEIEIQLAHIERAQNEEDTDVLEEDNPFRESPWQPQSVSGGSV